MYFERIKNTREDSDLTQKQMASIIGINRDNYSSMENGRISFSLNSISLFADYHNLSIDYLIGLTNTKRYCIKPNKSNLSNVGKNLRKVRRSLRLTQDNFASDLNITQPSYLNYEKGKVMISLNRLYTLAKKHNFSIDKLLEKIPSDIKN